VLICRGLLSTLHRPVVDTPGEIRGIQWRKARIRKAEYALGWRIYNYAGHKMVFHAGAVQGYRGMIAMLPELDLGMAVVWNCECVTPSGLLPTIMDRALALPPQDWLQLDQARRVR
jgi:beta-lactamase class C